MSPTDDTMTAATAVAAQFGLSESFLHQLRDGDDDWSFIIKCHALMESSLSVLLVSVLGKPEIKRTLSKLATGKKIDMCRDLTLFEEQDLPMMRSLSDLRNSLAHNANQVTFTFDEYLKDDAQARKFVNTFSDVWREDIEIKGKTVERRKFTQENPRLTIWTWIVFVLAEVELGRLQAEFERYKTTENEKLLERYQALVKKVTDAMGLKMPSGIHAGLE